MYSLMYRIRYCEGRFNFALSVHIHVLSVHILSTQCTCAIRDSAHVLVDYAVSVGENPCSGWLGTVWSREAQEDSCHSKTCQTGLKGPAMSASGHVTHHTSFASPFAGRTSLL